MEFMGNANNSVANEQLLPCFTLTDGRYREPEKKKRAMKPKKFLKDFSSLYEERRKADISLLQYSLRCDVKEALRMSLEELLAHARETLALSISRVPDIRRMTEDEWELIKNPIFEIDIFLFGSGIDPDMQYNHHVECLRMLDGSDGFRYIFVDLEFQKCIARELPRLNRRLFGREEAPETMNETAWITLIQKAWSKAKTAMEKQEIFFAIYQSVFRRRKACTPPAIRAAAFMHSVKRFGNVVERTMGSADPEVFLQAVVEELMEYQTGRVQYIARAADGKLLTAGAFIRAKLKELLGGNLPLAICHPDTAEASCTTVMQRAMAALPSSGDHSREWERKSIETSVRDGSLSPFATMIALDAEHIMAGIQEPLLRVAKEIRVAVECAEQPYNGYYPVGAKVHFPRAVPPPKLHTLNELFGFSRSVFTMLHANTSMLIPPRRSATEVVALLEELKRRGVIDEHSEIQTCIPGRLNNQYAALLGSSMLLSSFRCVTYDRSSFETSHDEQTASMIMAYDAGVLDRSVAALPDELTGRTDMLGRKDIRDVCLYQVLGSLISQAAYGGPFCDTGKDFIREYVALLERNRMLDILDAQWIHDDKSGAQPDREAHYLAVKRCTDTWLADNARYQATGRQEGLSFDVLRLLTSSINKAKITQERLGLIQANSPPLLLHHPNA